MTQTTLERPQHTPESDKVTRLDLSKITVSEHLSETSPFELRTIAPTAERPVAVYMAAPKVEDEEAMRGSFFAVKENGDAFWQADSDSAGIIRGYADGSLEQLGTEDDSSMTGTFKLGRNEKVYIIAQRFVETLKDKGLFNKDGANLALDDEDLRQEIIEVSFDDALAEVAPDTERAAHNIAARARRREEKRLRELQKQRATDDTNNLSTTSAQTIADDLDSSVDSATATPITAQSAYARRLRDAHRNARATRVIPENAPALSETAPAADSVTAERDIDDEERQYLEDQRRGFKVIDNRKWSRIEMLGHEVGVHSDVSFTVPPKPMTPKEVPTEAIDVVEPASAAPVEEEVVADTAPTVVLAPEKDPNSSPPHGSTVPFEVPDYNPNNDPSIEYGLKQLNALRAKMASLTANRQNRLFSFNNKKSREITTTYNDQVVALGRIVTADKLSDETLTDSQKNIAVTKFLVNEQAMLQAATKEQLEGTKEGKFVEWMSIRGRTPDSTADVRKVMQAVEQATSEDDKVVFAHQHMATLYKERIRGEKKERMKGATRVAAIGIVGMAATVLGINPSMAGDAANNMFYGARKK